MSRKSKKSKGKKTSAKAGTGIQARDIRISGTTGQVAIGSDNIQFQVLSGQEKKELRDNLLQFQKEIARMNLPPKESAKINGDVDAAIKETAKEPPDTATIQNRFQGALDTIKSVGDTIDKVSKWEWTKRIIKWLAKKGLSILI